MAILNHRATEGVVAVKSDIPALTKQAVAMDSSQVEKLSPLLFRSSALVST